MPVLDKWQKRQAEQHAKDNDVSYEAAVKDLFPDEPEQADEDEGQADEQAPAAPASKTGAKVDTTKAKA